MHRNKIVMLNDLIRIMLSIKQQIESKRLVCPATRQPLLIAGENLMTEDGAIKYPYPNGVPILFTDIKRQNEYLSENQWSMAEEYTTKSGSGLKKAIIRHLGGDYRSRESIEAFRQTIIVQKEDALCLSIGGGPIRNHHNLINLNIGNFPNVDVVADAYELPYANDSVDAIYCEAVLEHLEYPDKAVAEMHRTLRSGGETYIATPFMQLFHAYPNHFQNFTVIGHRRLFERAGFRVISSGVCVGPTFALSVLLTKYFEIYFPPIINKLMKVLVGIIGLCIRPLDKFLNKNTLAHVMASTTYVHVVKIL